MPKAIGIDLGTTYSVAAYLEGGRPVICTEYLARTNGSTLCLMDSMDHTVPATDVARFVAALERVDPTDGPPPGEHNSFRVCRSQRETLRPALQSPPCTARSTSAP